MVFRSPTRIRCGQSDPHVPRLQFLYRIYAQPLHILIHDTVLLIENRPDLKPLSSPKARS